MPKDTDVPKRYSPIRRVVGYGISFGCAGGAFAVTLIMRTWQARVPVSALFMFAIGTSVWFGGAGPGLLGIALSILFLGYLFHPAGKWFYGGWESLTYLFFFLSIGTVICVFSWRRRMIEERLNSGDTAVVNKFSTVSDAEHLEQQMLSTEVVRNSPDFVGVADAKTLQTRYVNPAGQALFGVDGDENVRRTHTLDYFADDERDRVRDLLVPALVTQGRLTVEVHGRNFKTGALIPLLVNSFVIPDRSTGAPAFIAAVAWDLTERKRAEEELLRRDLYLSQGESISHTGSWAWNESARLGFWSNELYRILGIEPGTIEPSPEEYLKCAAPEDRPDVEDVWEKNLIEGSGFKHKHRIIRPDGTVRHVCRIGRIVEIKPKQLEFIGAVMDVTEQHEDRTALQVQVQTIEDLLEQNRVLLERQREENISVKELAKALQNQIAASPLADVEQIIGSSPALQRVLVMVSHVASSDSSVLITGETGTGKELIARALHKNSRRADKPFLILNCASIPPALIGAELFGAEKGAFTGADKLRLGRFELANGGTLFLDEIGELPVDAQAALLRVLQEKTFERLGGTKSIKTDVRLIAATNRDLQVAMRVGTFRLDLFYRLNVVPIEIPPLRERKEDIPVLVEYFIRVMSAKHGKTIHNIGRRGMDALVSYSWPGNIRQLQNVIEMAVIVCQSDTLSIDEGLLPVASEGGVSVGSLQEEMTVHERKVIERALRASGGSVTGAARNLQISKSSLYDKIKTMNINPSEFSRD